MTKTIRMNEQESVRERERELERMFVIYFIKKNKITSFGMKCHLN